MKYLFSFAVLLSVFQFSLAQLPKNHNITPIKTINPEIEMVYGWTTYWENNRCRWVWTSDCPHWGCIGNVCLPQKAVGAYEVITGSIPPIFAHLFKEKQHKKATLPIMKYQSNQSLIF